MSLLPVFDGVTQMYDLAHDHEVFNRAGITPDAVFEAAPAVITGGASALGPLALKHGMNYLKNMTHTALTGGKFFRSSLPSARSQVRTLPTYFSPARRRRGAPLTRRGLRRQALPRRASGKRYSRFTRSRGKPMRRVSVAVRGRATNRRRFKVYRGVNRSLGRANVPSFRRKYVVVHC